MIYCNDYNGTVIPKSEIKKQLSNASQHIDTLTFNRIVGLGFENLTDFQKKIVSDVCEKLADYEYENAEILNSALKSYSINGVSVDFGNITTKEISGVYIPSDLYSLLEQTGLCCLSFNWNRGW